MPVKLNVIYESEAGKIKYFAFTFLFKFKDRKPVIKSYCEYSLRQICYIVKLEMTCFLGMKNQYEVQCSLYNLKVPKKSFK